MFFSMRKFTFKIKKLRLTSETEYYILKKKMIKN